MQHIIRHQSEFLVEIRDAIHVIANAPKSSPLLFYMNVYNAKKFVEDFDSDLLAYDR